MTWIERLATDDSLQTFVKAEVGRAVVELDTLRYQNQYLKMHVQLLTRQLKEARTELTRLRRKLGGQQGTLDGNED